MRILVFTQNGKDFKTLLNKKNKNLEIIKIRNLTQGIKELNKKTDLLIVDYNPHNSEVEPHYASSILAGYAFNSDIPTIGFLKDKNINYADRIKNYKVIKESPISAHAIIKNKKFLVENFQIPLNLMINESVSKMFSSVEEIEKELNIDNIKQYKQILKQKRNDIGLPKVYNGKKGGIYPAGPSVFIYGTTDNNLENYYNNPLEFKEKLVKTYGDKNIEINYPLDGQVKDKIWENPKKWFNKPKQIAYEIFKSDTKQMNNSAFGGTFDLQSHFSENFDPNFSFKGKKIVAKNATPDSGTLWELGYMLKLLHKGKIKKLIAYNLENEMLKKELEKLNVDIKPNLISSIEEMKNSYKQIFQEELEQSL